MRDARFFIPISVGLMTQAHEPDFPTRKVINSFQINEGFTNFNFYLTSVKVEKKLDKSLAVSILFITLQMLSK